MTDDISRRGFLGGTAALAAMPPLVALAGCQVAAPVRRGEERQNELISEWDEATNSLGDRPQWRRVVSCWD